jgi:large subunit ribosomal protein L24
MPISLIGEGKPPGVSIELPISISGVRLVHPIHDPKTGETKDAIINQLQHAGFIHDKVTGLARWSRVVPGLNMKIPWPQKAERDAVDHKVDTLRIDVEERTFIPTLLRPPMPENVLDELRNKYSRFRTRHEPEYLAAKEAEEQVKKDRVQLMDSMRTPLQEFHRAERERKKKKGKPRLTAEMLEEIGKVIAKNRERTMNAAGLSDVASSSAVRGAAVLENSSSETIVPPSSS